MQSFCGAFIEAQKNIFCSKCYVKTGKSSYHRLLRYTVSSAKNNSSNYCSSILQQKAFVIFNQVSKFCVSQCERSNGKESSLLYINIGMGNSGLSFQRNLIEAGKFTQSSYDVYMDLQRLAVTYMDGIKVLKISISKLKLYTYHFFILQNQVKNHFANSSETTSHVLTYLFSLHIHNNTFQHGRDSRHKLSKIK